MTFKGLRPEHPAKCPVEVYDLLKTCWLDEPSERPDFCSIAKTMKQLDKVNLKVAKFNNSYNDFGFADDADGAAGGTPAQGGDLNVADEAAGYIP